jgi:hypothetical protein
VTEGRRRQELVELDALLDRDHEHEAAVSTIDPVLEPTEHPDAVEIREHGLVDGTVALRREHEGISSFERARERDGSRTPDGERHGSAGKNDPTAQGEER